MPAMAGLVQCLSAHIAGHPLRNNNTNNNNSSSSSRAPMRSHHIDPENPVNHDEMLKMRRPDTMNDSVASDLHISDHAAATHVLEKMGPDQQQKQWGGDENRRNGDKATGFGIHLRHDPPSEPTATRLSYRDQNGRLHEVIVVDQPKDDYDAPS